MFVAALLAVITGSLLSGIMWIMVVAGIAGSFEKSVSVGDNTILTIHLAEDINDTPVTDPLRQIDFASMNVRRSLSLYNVLTAIDAARNDDRIKGIMIRPTGGGNVSLSTLEELRAALVDFKQSGKFIVAYNEYYTQGSYYLATVADKIYLQPQGSFAWQGMNFTLSFYKGLFDKLGLEAEIFRPTACKYKSAVEPYFLTRMSEANRRQMSELAESMWGTIISTVAEARGISIERLNRMADNLSVALPEDALEYGLVDGLLYEDQMNDVFEELGVEKQTNGEYNYVSLGDYCSQTVPENAFARDKIAIVYAEGDIVEGEGGDGSIGTGLAQTLKEVRHDDNVKAVVVRVNSPGGSALTSDVIWREMNLLKESKIVIVSMGGYAASGGYYISAPADAIVADRMTLTGSIGVFGLSIYTGKFFSDKLGVTFDNVASNTYADMGNTTRKITPAERAVMMRGVDKVYDTFTSLVAEGRNLPLDDVLEIAGGRVWSGAEALDTGLADANGGLKYAIALAADKAGLDNYGITELVDQPDGFMALLSSLNTRIKSRRTAAADPALAAVMREYAAVKRITERQGILTYCPYVIEIQ